jgi:hypothetical protein
MILDDEGFRQVLMEYAKTVYRRARDQPNT